MEGEPSDINPPLPLMTLPEPSSDATLPGPATDTAVDMGGMATATGPRFPYISALSRRSKSSLPMWEAPAVSVTSAEANAPVAPPLV